MVIVIDSQNNFSYCPLVSVFVFGLWCRNSGLNKEKCLLPINRDLSLKYRFDWFLMTNNKNIFSTFFYGRQILCYRKAIEIIDWASYWTFNFYFITVDTSSLQNIIKSSIRISYIQIIYISWIQNLNYIALMCF